MIKLVFLMLNFNNLIFYHRSDSARLMNINLWRALIYGHVWLAALAGVVNPINFPGQFFSKRN
jgi:hypothetical protein